MNILEYKDYSIFICVCSIGTSTSIGTLLQ